jgi:hypothetical protein
MTSFDSIWVGPPSTHTQDPSPAPGSGDVYVSNRLLLNNGIEGYSETLPLFSLLKGPYITSPVLSDGVYGATYPQLTVNNGVWTLYWPASQTASIVYPMKRVKPWATGENIAWRVLARWTGTYSTPTQASKYLQWSLQVNTEDSTIQTASTAMTAVAISPITTASQVTYELVPSAAAQASLISGAWYTLMIGPSAHNVASGTGAGNLYILGIEEYTP